MNSPHTSLPPLLITKRLPGGQGLAPALLKRAAIVKLDEAQSHQHALEVTDEQGQALKIQLPEGTHLHAGDVLVAEDGSLRVVDAPAHADCGAHDHGHDHGHAHDHHDHDHGPDHSHAGCSHPSHAKGKPVGIPVQAAPVPHVHGPGCKH